MNSNMSSNMREMFASMAYFKDFGQLWRLILANSKEAEAPLFPIGSLVTFVGLEGKGELDKCLCMKVSDIRKFNDTNIYLLARELEQNQTFQLIISEKNIIDCSNIGAINQ